MSSVADVLIVGAGPSGLMMACQLAINGIPFRIIDKSEDHTSQSRALVVQARSIEIFDQMGIAEKAIQHGQVAKAIGAFFNGKKALRLPVNKAGEGLTRFPFFLMLEQSCTESILIDFLNTKGYQVERQKNLISYLQGSDESTALLRSPDGSEETVRFQYIIGADGAHSIVRNQMNIDFVGSTYEQSLFVLDCKAEVDIPHDEMYLTFAKKAVGGLFPLTNGRWRILGNLPKELEGKKEVRFEDIEKNYAERVRLNIRLFDPHWISVYRTHHRYASTFRKNRCFLIGDAAHIHSPVGAQGMNTGLQDAYNLAWKLSLVIKGKAKDNLLNTYTEERMTVARNLVRTTDRAFNLFTSPNQLLKAFRLYFIPVGLKLFVPIFLKLRFLQRIAFTTVSEIGINYRNNLLSKNASHGSFPKHAPKPGDRMPYIPYCNKANEETNLHKRVSANSFTLFIFSDKAEDLIEKFQKEISIETIPFSKKTKNLYNRLGISSGGCYLVRPDMYVAFRSNNFDQDQLSKYLLNFLIV